MAHSDIKEARGHAPTLELLRAHRSEILELAASHGVSNIRVFGSVARGDAGVDSDIDLLVEWRVQRSGLELIGFALELERLLGHGVEVVTAVHEVIRKRVEEQAVPL